MAKIGQKKGKAKFAAGRALSGGGRISPLKPGLSGARARNWATAQLRSARYSKQKMTRLVITATILVLFVLWGGLWLGGFTPNITSSYDRFVQKKLTNMGFVVKHVDVVGESRVREEKVREMLGVQPGDYLFDMDIQNAQARIQTLSWVETAVVRRLWPNRIVVHINERRPFALWQNNQQLHVVDSSGVEIRTADANEFADLPLVVGKGAAENAQSIWDMLNSHPEVLARTQAAVFVGQRRWDVVLTDGMRILLPEQNPKAALQRFDSYNREHDLLSLDVRHIDMRIKGRLIIKPKTENDSRTKSRRKA